jgi:hypothetical protein
VDLLKFFDDSGEGDPPSEISRQTQSPKHFPLEDVYSSPRVIHDFIM